ncbi:venom acid phosphatase Acph-1-like [Trichogramma pretiosum]|uniref:venom acid phosphatase Acph-1-like n=1 Tax=Trichogramma pretiosum TaxID=7493 RepID=UPI0006C9A3D4|nr:venom acid phosphatase Acph-1-like [Trichogramma pretiosum]
MSKNDPYDEQYFKPKGYGQLTLKGMKRVYETGKMLRDRYGEFLGSYKPQDVYAFSTNFDRTKMSLQLLLAGLYPPNPETMWNKDIPWIPIPTHYLDNDKNYLWFEWSGPEFDKHYKPILESAKITEILNRYNHVLEHAQNNTGKPLVGKGLIPTIYLTNYLHSVVSMGLPLPDWCSEETFQALQELASLAFKSLSMSNPLAKMTAGPVANVLLKNIQNHESQRDERKIFLYSCHDSTLGRLLGALKISNNPGFPEFASAVITETLRDDDGKKYVRMLFWAGVSRNLINLDVPGCNSLCTLQEYENALKIILPA